MSHPYSSDDRTGRRGGGWDDAGSEETQVVRPASGGDDQASSRSATAEPYSAPTPSVTAPALGSPIGGSESAGWSSYPEPPVYPSQPALTSVYPPSAPGYAPGGYPSAYTPSAAPPDSRPAGPVGEPSSRIGPGLASFVIGLILTAGGVLAGAKYGIAAAADLTQQSVVIKDSALATVGALLLLAAVLLNGWSPWATLVPGIVLTGVGGWALFDAAAAGTLSGWTKRVLTQNQLSAWHISGFTLILGLVLLGASVAAAIARASGKRDGQLIGRRPY